MVLSGEISPLQLNLRVSGMPKPFALLSYSTVFGNDGRTVSPAPTFMALFSEEITVSDGPSVSVLPQKFFDRHITHCVI